jgi:carbamoyl-phosphate synthase small subunit
MIPCPAVKASLQPGILLLEDGTVFEGEAVSPGTRFGEVVFNTSMTGYQEVLTDPSYRGQIVVMTQPHIGNYGTTPEVAESGHPWVEGFIARQFTARPSSHEGDESLISYLRRFAVPALQGLDTRALVRRLRERGALRGVLTTERSDVDRLAAELADVKTNILRSLARRGARLTVVPARTPASDILALSVDGVVLSNGPGDPEPLTGIIDTVRELLAAEIPVFGICLGHQLLGLALGGRTFKLKFGHHGGNQPVRDLTTGRVAITSQNHGFAVDPDSLPVSCAVTQINLNDGTVEGFAVSDKPVYSVQYHPEAAPGPHDASVLFDRFLDAATRK